MLDGNWKTWLILAIAFVGGCFEVFKHVPVKGSVSWEEENLHYGADGKPYAVHHAQDSYTSRPQAKAVHIAGDSKVLQDEMKKFVAANKPTQTEAEHKAAAAKKDEKDKKKKKKKKDKKDAKKEEKPVEPVKIALPKPQVPDDNGADAIAKAVSEAAQTGQLPPVKPTGHEPFASLQEWERRLLNRPDLNATNEFIQDFKNHTVSTDVFYTVTKLMVADPRNEMKDLGVMCAGSTHSVVSFEILAGVAKNSKNSSEVQNRATTFLNQYSNVANLPILQNVLRSGDVTSQTLALSYVDSAITKQQPSTTPTTQSTRVSVTQVNQFIAIVNPLTQSHDSSLATAAQRTLQDLQSYLQSAQSTSNIATTNTP